jgi:hypothetical protein
MNTRRETSLSVDGSSILLARSRGEASMPLAVDHFFELNTFENVQETTSSCVPDSDSALLGEPLEGLVLVP